MHKRFETRRGASVPIELITSFSDEPIDLVACDLSPRGVYIKSEFLPEQGEHLVCSFELNWGGGYCFFGEVVRVNLLRRRTDLGWPGFGVRFLDARPIDRLRIRSALRGCPPPVPRTKRAEVITLSESELIEIGA